MRAAALLLLLANPVSAQDADPAGQLIEGYVACLMARGNPEAIASNLSLYGWSTEAPTDGVAIAYPGTGYDTFLLTSQDASFCHIESLLLGTASASEMLDLSATSAGLTLPAPVPDAQGCATYDFGDGILATLTGGGDSAACPSDTTSALLITFAPQD